MSGEAITREAAKKMLASDDLARLSKADREAELLDWWSLDEMDEEFCSLPQSLQDEMKVGEFPKNPFDPVFEPLLLVGLESRYVGVANSYILHRLMQMGTPKSRLIGEPEPRSICPCCFYKSLPSRGEYSVCPVCFWEDDGSDDPIRFSGPNHMTLGEGRENFQKFSACSKDAMRLVLPDGKSRFARAGNGDVSA